MSQVKPSPPNTYVAPEPPSGTVSLLFTDVEASTQLLEALGDEFPVVILRTRELLKDVIGTHDGVVVDSQGDSVFAAFRLASDAVGAAVAIQRTFASEQWPSNASIRVRVGIHTGRPMLLDGRYFGLDVHRAARIAAAGSGGQVLLSAATRAELTEVDVPAGVQIRDLGAHRLKDIRYPEVLFDLSIPGLPESFASLKSIDAHPNNLPMAATTFVGRELQLQELRTLLLQDATRLLTLIGPGGTGKTRLAVEVARSLMNNFPHGVFLVQLEAVDDASLLASTIVQTLGIPEFASRTPLDSLKHHLAQRETLLLLDNFEQIIEAGTALFELLGSCPGLKVLVTSREALNVRFERQYPVSPLQLPDADDPPSLESAESVRLFVDRVRNYDPHFTLTPENAKVIRAICVRLDGLPLALELAAAQLRLFTPRSLLEHLQDSLEVLVGGPRDLPRHQRTLRDTIAWSYRLLTPDEQLMFRRLSVFKGGSTPDSALAIGLDGVSRAVALDAIMCLVRKSLLTQSVVLGETRVSMLQTIQEFAEQQLAATSESTHIHERHAEHYLALAEKMARGLRGRQQRTLMTTLAAEEDNLRAALAWAIQRGDSELTSRLITALLWMWIPRGKFEEGRTWTKRALDRFGDIPASRDLALMLEAAGWLAVLGGDYPTALPLFERAHDIFQAEQRTHDYARAKTALGVTCLVLGDSRGADLSDEALALCESLGDKEGKALALLSAGIKHQVSGSAALATTCYERALHAFYDADNVFWPGQILQNLAHLRLQEGDWQRAATLAIKAFDVGREYDYPMIISLSLAVMGAVLVAMQMPTRAAQFFGAVDTSLAELGVTFEPPEQAVMTMNIDATKALLGAESYATAFDEGRRWRDSHIIAAVASLRAEAGVH